MKKISKIVAVMLCLAMLVAPTVPTLAEATQQGKDLGVFYEGQSEKFSYTFKASPDLSSSYVATAVVKPADQLILEPEFYSANPKVPSTMNFTITSDVKAKVKSSNKKVVKVGKAKLNKETGLYEYECSINENKFKTNPSNPYVITATYTRGKKVTDTITVIYDTDTLETMFVRIPATCETDGWSGFVLVSDMEAKKGKLTKDDVVAELTEIPALGHNYVLADDGKFICENDITDIILLETTVVNQPYGDVTEYVYNGDVQNIIDYVTTENRKANLAAQRAYATAQAEYAALVDRLVAVDAVAATCTEDGNIAYYTDPENDDAIYIYDEENDKYAPLAEGSSVVVAATNHDYPDEWTLMDDSSDEELRAFVAEYTGIDDDGESEIEYRVCANNEEDIDYRWAEAEIEPEPEP